MEGTAKGQDVQNGWEGPDLVFWNFPSHEEQGEQEKQQSEVPLEMVSEAGGSSSVELGR